ncbi:MAG: flippase-like domain-containing protein [Candidatus Melainabacteria bacterium]|nr:flippase-like domain-containing protein [Candidatus Melainabacteria bacterium]
MTGKEKEVDHRSKIKQQIKNLLRLVISIVAFICLIKFGKVDVKVAVKYLTQVNPLYFALAYISYFITTLVAGVRFYFSSHVLGFRKNYFQLVQLNFVGAFFNNFLPTTIGGDALRGYYLKRGSHIPLSRAVACIVYERYTGMIVLFWATSAAFIMQDLGFISKSLWNVPHQLAIFCHIGSVITIFLVPFLPQLNNLFFGKTNWVYKTIIEPILVYWHDLKLTVRIVVLSVLLQIFVILCHFFIAKSLNMNIPLSYYLVFYPLTTLAGFMIPSLNGLGIREGTYIYFLKKVNITSDQGLAFSICWLIILLITSIIGGIIYMVGDFRKHKPLT